MYIKSSVGKNGKNNVNDVYFVQAILALISEEDMRMPDIDVDGKCGPITIESITKFQRFYVQLRNPDGRVDPNGRSEKTLVAKALEIDRRYLDVLAKEYNLKKVGASTHQVGPKVITYRHNVTKPVSEYSENIIKLAMSYGGISRCDISSTLRTFADQARIMYDNCASFPDADSVDSLRSARGWGYAAPGREVEGLYYKNLSLGRDATIAAMEARIEEIYRKGIRVSLHCVSEADYKANNILDIPYSSVINSGRKNFEVALMGMSQEVQNVRYKRPIAGEIYINKLIVENRCWHLEIAQLNKPLPNQNRSIALTDMGPKGRRGKERRRRTPPAGLSSSFISFLDRWF